MALTKASRGAATRGLHAGMYRPSGAKGPFLLPDQGLTPLAISFRRSAASKSTDRKLTRVLSAPGAHNRVVRNKTTLERQHHIMRFLDEQDRISHPQ